MSTDNLLAKFDQMVQRFKKEFNEIIEEERSKIKAELELYNAEKERMKAFTVNDNDIIHLNVGGKKLTTKRSTLCQVEGSLLSTMFSGRWEDSLERDQDGAVFFDFNPQHFVLILDYLRAKRIATPEKPTPLPKVAEDQVENFNNLIQYFGLSDEISPTEIVASEKFNLHSPGVSLEEDGKVAVNAAGTGFRYVLGENVYEQNIMNLKLKLESLRNNNWMFVGIVKGDVVPPANNSYEWRGSYGWTLGLVGRVCKDGSCTNDAALHNLTKQDDTVELVLDCDAAKLSLHLTTGQQFQIETPKSQTWRLNINLNGPNDKIRIMNQ